MLNYYFIMPGIQTCSTKNKKTSFEMDYIDMIHKKASIIFYFIYPRHIRDFLYVRAWKKFMTRFFHASLFSSGWTSRKLLKILQNPQTSTPSSSCEQARKIEGVVFLIPSVWYLFARTNIYIFNTRTFIRILYFLNKKCTNFCKAWKLLAVRVNEVLLSCFYHIIKIDSLTLQM